VTKKAVVLNDSNPDGVHFGCMRVMDAIRTGLSSRGIDILAVVPHATEWMKDPQWLAQVQAADVIVINGEGTFHHGSRKARWLLDAVEVAKQTGAKTALVNALWQDNPADFAALAAELDDIYCRDSRSAEELTRALGRHIEWFGDLSLYAAVPKPASDRTSTILLGDSVHSTVTRRIAALARPLAEAGRTTRIVPVVNQLRQISPSLVGWRRMLRSALIRLRQRQFVRQFPETHFAKTDIEYLAELQSCALSVTGRFHAACLALATETPFIAVSSNSWKMEALIEDVGLSHDRLVPIGRLDAECVSGRDWSFTPAELVRVREYLATAQRSADAMWDDILRSPTD